MSCMSCNVYSLLQACYVKNVMLCYIRAFVLSYSSHILFLIQFMYFKNNHVKLFMSITILSTRMGKYPSKTPLFTLECLNRCEIPWVDEV